MSFLLLLGKKEEEDQSMLMFFFVINMFDATEVIFWDWNVICHELYGV